MFPALCVLLLFSSLSAAVSCAEGLFCPTLRRLSRHPLFFVAICAVVVVLRISFFSPRVPFSPLCVSRSLSVDFDVFAVLGAPAVDDFDGQCVMLLPSLPAGLTIRFPFGFSPPLFLACTLLFCSGTNAFKQVACTCADRLPILSGPHEVVSPSSRGTRKARVGARWTEGANRESGGSTASGGARYPPLSQRQMAHCLLLVPRSS